MTKAGDYKSWKGWSENEFGTLKHIDRIYFASELSGCIGNIKDKNILELGFGNGNFLAFCRNEGAQVTGVELDPELVQYALAQGFSAHLYSDDLLDSLGADQFDAVVAFDVLEHIEFDTLLVILMQIRKILRPGGCLFARFPSGDSPFSGAMFNGDHTHRTLIGTGKLQQISGIIGLDVEQMRGARLPVFGLGARKAAKRVAVLVLRRMIAAILIPIFYSNVPRVIDPNAVCVLRKRRMGA